MNKPQKILVTGVAVAALSAAPAAVAAGGSSPPPPPPVHYHTLCYASPCSGTITLADGGQVHYHT